MSKISNAICSARLRYKLINKFNFGRDMYKCNMRILERERERGRVGTEFGETVQTRDEMTIW